MWIYRRNLRAAIKPLKLSPAATSSPDPELDVALRAANKMLRILSRSGFLWRDTCLYRSIAQCLVLRTFSRSASLRLGVRENVRDIKAHAWVEYDGPERVEPPGPDFEELRFAG